MCNVFVGCMLRDDGNRRLERTDSIPEFPCNFSSFMNVSPCDFQSLEYSVYVSNFKMVNVPK